MILFFFSHNFFCQLKKFMDTEPSFYGGINCRCGSNACRGVLSFGYYRNVDWQNKYYKYCGVYVKKRIDELRTKWFSGQCYLKHYDQELGLTSLNAIGKGQLVAKFSDPANLNPTAHYIRHSDDPTCYLDGEEVLTLRNVDANTELTLKF